VNKTLFAKDRLNANKLSAEVKKGKLKRIYHGIYSVDLDIPDSEIVQKNWIEIISFIVPGGILSYRSALDLRLIPYQDNNKIVFMTSTYSKTINLPGLIIKISKGQNTDFTEQFHPDLLRSNEARSLLENLSTTRSLQGVKTIGKEEVEIRLAKILHNRTENGLNKVRDEAKVISEKLNLTREFKILNAIISSLLSTHNENNILVSSYAKALIKKEPYDAGRIKLFTDLSLYLQKCDFIERNYKYERTSFKNLSFFEAYFSNYIEGTRFVIDEAEDIVFSGKAINNRHADSHDVLANFRICNEYLDISKTPGSANEFINLLQSRHAILMSERTDIFPGEFKNKDNKAGNTFFVRTKDVVGTLVQAFDIYSSLKDGMHRALFIHFVLTEVHPFNDGNGRISRIMLNSELVKSHQYKIIIPNVYRESYMGALRSVTRDSYFLAYCKMMDTAQAYTASITWNDYPAARGKIEVDRAEKEEDEGLPIFNRAIQKLILTEFPK
jgi:hypothetical protein